MPRGGSRPGSGRKTYNISEREKRKLLREARRIERESGRSIAAVLMEFIFTAHKYPSLKLTAIRLFYDIITVRESSKKIEEHKYDHRVVVLPEIKRPKDEEIAKA